MSDSVIYDRLRSAILEGKLSPGERLVEEELADRLGAGRAAVRAAIVRLDHEGLVVRERNRGARVRRVTAEEGIEILEARAALESLAAGYAALRRTDAEARELRQIAGDMKQLQAKGELLAMSERNAELHRRILEISGHRVARDICERLRSQIVRFQFRTVLASGRSKKSLAEHFAVVDAIAAGDRRAAERAMRTHLNNVAATLVEVAASERLAS